MSQEFFATNGSACRRLARPEFRRLSLGLLVCLMCGLLADPARSADKPDGRPCVIHADIEYAKVKQHSLKLDLYLPTATDANTSQWPLVVWVHGGAWRKGDKSSMPWQSLVPRGFAIASVNYRLSPQAAFPAQIHDIKAAIRFLRFQAKRYGYSAQRIAIAGASAGGHLAALVGVTNRHALLGGNVGTHCDVSDDVHAVVDLYGPTNLLTILPQSTPHGLSVRIPALRLLLDGPLDRRGELAALASPVQHVDAKDPPVLLLHGDQDPQVPINQSHELVGKYRSVEASAQLIVLHGAAHGGPQFTSAETLARVETFLRRHLLPDSQTKPTEKP